MSHEIQIDGDQKELSLVDHIRELRNRVAVALIAWILASIICFQFAGDIYQFLLEPLKELYNGKEGKRLIFTSLTEGFTTYLKLALFTGFVFVLPITLWQVYRFVSPGLYNNEKKVLWPFLLGAPLLFVAGAATAYYFVFPLAWNFFLSFEMPAGADALPIELEAKVSDYLSLVMRFIMAFGIAYQMPIVLMLLAHAGFITGEGLKAKRRYAILGIFVLAAIITPPDIISQIGLAIPMLILYEVSVYMCGSIAAKKKEHEDA